MLPKTAEYALRAVVWLSREPGKPESAQQLAEATQVPRRYLHKVLQDLGRAGLVRSQPGPGGGYAFHGDPAAVTILDVIRAVGPIPRIDRCPLEIASHTELCPLHRELGNAYAAMEQAFGRVTVAELTKTPAGESGLCRLA